MIHLVGNQFIFYYLVQHEWIEFIGLVRTNQMFNYLFS